MDIVKNWIEGSIELDRIKQLHMKKIVIIKECNNGFKKYYCPNCKEEFCMKEDVCSCGQFIEWINQQPMY